VRNFEGADPLLCAMSPVKFRPHFFVASWLYYYKNIEGQDENFIPSCENHMGKDPRTLRITYVVTSEA
jgi:hypothetical protein